MRDLPTLGSLGRNGAFFFSVANVDVKWPTHQPISSRGNAMGELRVHGISDLNRAIAACGVQWLKALSFLVAARLQS